MLGEFTGIDEMGLLKAALVWLALFVFGYAYNWCIDKRRHKGCSEAEVHWWVVVGVGITLVIGVPPFYGWAGLVWMISVFAFSGFWMVVGYEVDRRWKHRRGQELIRDGNETKRLAQ